MGKYLHIILVILCMTTFFACSEEKPKSNGPKWTDDTVQTQNSKIIDPQDLTQVLPDESKINFDSRYRKLAEALFSEDYKEDKMDVIEMAPRWRSATKSTFTKYLRNQTISNDYGKKIYIRPVLKAWEFPDEKTMRNTLSEWLNGHESSDPDSIVLGENVNALKSPPFICAVHQTQVFMLFSACVYTGEASEALVEAFMQEFDQKGTLYRFEVACGAGKLTYRTKTEDNDQI